MNLDQWRQAQGWTWERLARELSYKCREYGEDPLYSNRLWHFRKGKGKRPQPHHFRALHDLTDYEVEVFREE